MSDLISDGKTRVAWVTTIGDISAPTVAELEAGIDLTERITPDGLKIDPSTADVDNSSLASRFDTKTAGRVGFENELTLKRGTTTPEDLPYNTLLYGVEGHLVVRRGLDYETEWEADQVVEVYPTVCGEPANVSPAANEVSKFVSPQKVKSAPDTRAVVAA